MITSHQQYERKKEYAEVMQLVIAVAEESKALKPDRRAAIVEEATKQYDEIIEALEAWEGQSK
jgi:flagellar biosynthesis regulator FlaF